MNTLKSLTRAFTGFLVVAIVLVIAYALAKLGQAVGLWPLVDTLYPKATFFWGVFIITRLIFSWVWIKVSEYLIEGGTQAEFFWFKPDKYAHLHSRDDEPNLDYSGRILGFLAIAVIMSVVSDLVIRVSTWTTPPYMTGN